MGAYSGPEISNDGLVLSLDMGNFKSFRGLRNTANLSTWNYGTGTVTNWSINGEGAANQRIANTNPLGYKSIIWDTPSNDAASDADGGFNSGYWAIDPAYYYRFSVWIKRYVLGNGSYYMGLYGINGVNANMGVLTRSGGANSTNPYFHATSWTLNTDDWYLFVGHVHPAGTGTGSNHPDTGIYNVAAGKINSNGSDYTWIEGTAKTMIRSYLYYSTDTTTAQCWWQPRIDKMDGTEPSIAELVSGVGGKIIDLSKTCTAGGFCANGAENFYMTSDPIAAVFNGANSHILVPDFPDLSSTNKLTVSCWVKSHTSTWNKSGCIVSRRNQFILHSNLGGATVNYYVYTAAGFASIQIGLSSITVWNHLVMTYNAGALKAYVNGVLGNSSSVNGTLGSQTGTLEIGSDINEAADRFLDGRITITQIWNRDLSGDEVAKLYNSQRARHGV